MACILAIYSFNSQIKEGMLNGASGTHERCVHAYRSLVGIVKEGDEWEDLSVDGRIILKEFYMILKGLNQLV
jgi:hypothetical protein